MQMNEHADNKRTRLSNKNIVYDASRMNGNKEALLNFNRLKDDMRHRIVPNAHGHGEHNGMFKGSHLTPDMLQRKIQLEQLLKRASMESSRSAQLSRLELIGVNVKSEPGVASITPVRVSTSI